MNQRKKDLAMISVGLELVKADKLRRVGDIDNSEDVEALVRDIQRCNKIKLELEENYKVTGRQLHMKKLAIITATRNLQPLQFRYTRATREKSKLGYASEEYSKAEKKCVMLSNQIEAYRKYLIDLAMASSEEEIREAINNKPSINK